MTHPIDSNLDTTGALELDVNHHHFAGHRRIDLLRHIEATGSISQAARSLGMSYKQAWDSVDAMNNLSAVPLVRRRTGGRHGGGTELTDDGRRLIEVFDAAELEHQRFLDRLTQSVRDFDQFHSLLGVLNMRVSARNHLHGVIRQIQSGPVNSEITLDVNGTPLIAVITNDSVQSLELQPGREVFALIKASFVILASADGDLKISARNRLCGTVEHISTGPVNCEVVLALEGGVRLTATVTAPSLDNLELTEGDRACALIKASHIILAISD